MQSPIQRFPGDRAVVCVRESHVGRINTQLRQVGDGSTGAAAEIAGRRPRGDLIRFDDPGNLYARVARESAEMPASHPAGADEPNFHPYDLTAPGVLGPLLQQGGERTEFARIRARILGRVPVHVHMPDTARRPLLTAAALTSSHLAHDCPAGTAQGPGSLTPQDRAPRIRL